MTHTVHLIPFTPFLENILVNGAPSQEEWWGEQEHGDGEELKDMEIQYASSKQQFHNCGFDAWEQGRAEWKKATVVVRPPRPPPVRYDVVARGIRGGSRQFELPGRMRLSDLVDVYTDVWECDSDPW